MSVGDIGIAFKFMGADKAMRDMRSLKGEYGSLSSAVDRSALRVRSGMQRMADGMKLSAQAAIASIGALTAAAIAVPLKLAQSRTELTNEQANLRALGLDDAAIAKFEESAEQFSTKVAGVTKAAYTKASYDVVSAFAGISTEEQAKITDISLLTGKATKMSAESSTKLFGSLWGAAGDEIKKQGAQPFVEKWSGSVYTAVKELKTTGEELASAAKNSISMLMEAGWKPEEMTAFWGQLITSGLSGEAAGTALKQMAVKEQGGFGKLLAKTSGNWTDTEFLTGESKKIAEFRNKGLTEGYGAQGAQLFKSDPLKWLNRMGDAFDKLKASGEDYKKFLGEVFGEESINAMMQFFEKRGQMKDTIDKIAKGSFGDVRKIVEEEMSKGIGPARSILGQLWENLTQTMGKTTEGSAIGGFKWIGDKLLKLNALWKALFTDTAPQDAIDGLRAAGGEGLVDLYKRLKGLPENIAAFFEGAKAGFTEFLTGLGATGAKVDALIDSLGTVDTAKWREMGEELGKMAGTSLKGLIDGLGEVKAVAADLFGFLQPIMDVMKFAAKGWKQGSEAWKEFGKDDFESGTANLSRMFDDSSALEGPPASRTNPAFPGWKGRVAPERPKMAAQPLTGESPRVAAGASAQPRMPLQNAPTMPMPAPINLRPQISVEPAQFSVRIGEREFQDIVTETIKGVRTRYRQGAGDSFEEGYN